MPRRSLDASVAFPGLFVAVGFAGWVLISICSIFLVIGLFQNWTATIEIMERDAAANPIYILAYILVLGLPAISICGAYYFFLERQKFERFCEYLGNAG